MTFLIVLLSGALLIPYFGWGIYTLRVRYRYHEEFAIRTEFITLAAVAAFFAIELRLLHQWMSDNMVLYLFTALSLAVSGAALYGPILISMTSQLLVDILIAPQGAETHTPQFAPAEALERAGDYHGAVQECLTIARIFPKDPSVSLRIADNLTKQDKFAESVEWFERALGLISDSEHSLAVANRLAGIFQRQLDQPEAAVGVLERYIEDHPTSERAGSVRMRLARMQEPEEPAPAPHVSDALERPPTNPLE